jgi:uncharacterized ubiquitin-like protein YukD
MIDYVLVTVKYSNKMEKDMELPAQIEISKLSDMLLETLQTAEPLLFSDKSTLEMEFKGKKLMSGTLYDNKVWDGSILNII